jgi:hypothetical protein
MNETNNAETQVEPEQEPIQLLDSDEESEGDTHVKYTILPKLL